MPRSTVIPELAYPDVGEAVAWLSDAFGFSVRIQIGNHRAQLNVGDGAVVLTQRRGPDGAEVDVAHAVMVRVDDVNGHHERARQQGALVIGPPTDYPYGERQYTVVDPGGHHLEVLPVDCRCRSHGLGRHAGHTVDRECLRPVRLTTTATRGGRYEAVAP